MKLIVTQFTQPSNHWEVAVFNSFTNQNTYIYSFETRKEADAFCDGFFCAKSVINSLVQSLPISTERQTK